MNNLIEDDFKKVFQAFDEFSSLLTNFKRENPNASPEEINLYMRGGEAMQELVYKQEREIMLKTHNLLEKSQKLSRRTEILFSTCLFINLIFWIINCLVLGSR